VKRVFGSCLTMLMLMGLLPSHAATAAVRIVNPDVTVMSYNIHFGVGLDGRYDLNRIARVIQASNADIVGLQEVDVHYGPRSHFDNQARLLATRLHMHYYFAPIYDFPPFHPALYMFQPSAMVERRQSGVAVLSRFPIVQAINHPLARLSTEELQPTVTMERGFAEVFVNVDGNRIPVYVTHLDYRPNPRVRFLQVSQMYAILTRTPGSRQILLGDLNARPAAPELEPFLFRLLQDTVSCNDACGTFPADLPHKRIDYVLTAPDWKVIGAMVQPTTASDHRPVIAHLRLK